MKRWSIAVVFCLTCVVGCSQGTSVGTVHGTVTMDGKPMPNVLVTFQPKAGGGASTGKTDASGIYELIYMDKKGAVVGEHLVAVTPSLEAPPVKSMSSDDPEYAKQAAGGGAAAYAKKQQVPNIPARYNSSSELKKEVKSGSNEINLELKSS